ncbi:MAG: hypothetical protein Q7U54_10640 [Bacteroidales bacterium]|nr:hypothetical protein [Bacteroidales bacterium]
MKIKSLLFLLCLYTGISSAQETRQKFIGAEAGIVFIESEMPNLDYIRGEIASYPGGYTNSSLTGLSYKSYFGIKPGYFTLNNKLGIQVGIRFTRINNSVGKNSYLVNTTDYFYFLYREDGVNTEYLKVNQIIQKSDYLGIPVEISYFPFNPRLFRFYFKIGAELNFRLQTRTDIVFNDDAMEIYQTELAAKVGQPGTLNISAYGAAGVRLGRESKPSFSVELSLPCLFLTTESSGLANPLFGSGIQVNYQIPIKSKVQ